MEDRFKEKRFFYGESMRKFLRIAILALACAGLPILAAADATRQGLERKVGETLDLQRETAVALEKWQVQQQELEEKLHAQELEEKLLAARLVKLEGYRDQRLAEIERLEKGLQRMTEIGLRLEPFLDELVLRIEEMSEKGLPFARPERQRRLAELKESLNRYEVSLADKLRRCLEVLAIEAGFGRGFEVSEETLPVDGVETTVRVLRLGRVGLYYLTLDGSKAGWYEAASARWQALPTAAAEAIKEALRMALKQRAFDLVRLPVGGGGHE